MILSLSNGKAELTVILLYVPYLYMVVKACVRAFLKQTRSAVQIRLRQHIYLFVKMDMLAGISAVENGYNTKRRLLNGA